MLWPSHNCGWKLFFFFFFCCGEALRLWKEETTWLRQSRVKVGDVHTLLAAAGRKTKAGAPVWPQHAKEAEKKTLGNNKKFPGNRPFRRHALVLAPAPSHPPARAVQRTISPMCSWQGRRCVTGGKSGSRGRQGLTRNKRDTPLFFSLLFRGLRRCESFSRSVPAMAPRWCVAKERRRLSRQVCASQSPKRLERSVSSAPFLLVVVVTENGNRKT